MNCNTCGMNRSIYKMRTGKQIYERYWDICGYILWQTEMCNLLAIVTTWDSDLFVCLFVHLVICSFAYLLFHLHIFSSFYIFIWYVSILLHLDLINCHRQHKFAKDKLWKRKHFITGGKKNNLLNMNIMQKFKTCLLLYRTFFGIKCCLELNQQP